MSLAFGGLLAGLFIGWWSGTVTATVCTFLTATLSGEADLATGGGT